MELPEQLTAVLSHDLTQLALTALALYLIPNRLLVKVPVVGAVLEQILSAYARKQISDRLKTEALIDEKADRIVTAKEQLIRSGVLDPSSARAQAMLELRGMFSVGPEQASDVIEAAVYRLNRGPRPLESGTLFAADVIRGDLN